MTTDTPAANARSANMVPGIEALRFARRYLLKLLDGIPPEKLTYQPFAGANHAMWQVGHMAWTDHYFLANVAKVDSTFEESWNGLFGMGSEPTDDASKYPPIDEVVSVAEKKRGEMIDWLASLSEDEANTALPDDWSSFAPTYAALAGSMACHEGVHTGQLAMLRKSMGMAPAYG